MILDCLAARFRLGETFYTFDSRLAPALRVLEQRGLVVVMDGNVERSVRAYLTDAGRTEALYDGYQSPLEEKVERLERRVEGTLEELRIALDRVPANA